MARSATTTDAFNAIAEARRRRILDLVLDGEEHSVLEFVSCLSASQPSISKHLAVLRKVGLLLVRRRGSNRLYRINALKLKPVLDWVERYKRLWIQ
ncbi:helix-turn-helix transcriptional regulator [Acidobacteria bacterium AB60]|nr:helix-turn-helix transcriptional regulator [Acidobacteria bacterium AB60]